MTVSRVTDESARHNAHILIVDDEHAARHTLAELLGRLGYRVTEAESGQMALEHMSSQDFDLVILDLKMPEMDGTEVLEAGHALAPNTVFIILTAYGTLHSAIASIRHGAFNYLLKPSSVKDIVKAIEAGLAERQRRLRNQDPVALLEWTLADIRASAQQPKTSPTTKRFLQAADIIVDTLRQFVFARGEPVDLTPTEFEILTHLMRHQDRVVSCREMVAHVRGYDLDERDARTFLRSHIHRLRHKLEPDPAKPRIIRTVRGSGYIIPTDAANKRDSPAS